MISVIVLWGAAWVPKLGRAQTAAATMSATEQSSSPLQVELGLGGLWKLGHLCPVRMRFEAELQLQATEVEIQTVDGDGVAVVYSLPLTRDSFSPAGIVWLPIRIGRQSAELTVRVLGADEVLHQQVLAADSVGNGLSSSQPLIVAIGSSMGVESLSRKSADGSNATFSTVTLTAADALPPHWSDYSSCDLLILSDENPELLRSVSQVQWAAIDQWIRRGGAGIVSLAREAEELAQLPPLAELLPGTVVGETRVNNPAPIETLVATEEPLSGFACSLLAPTRGKVELTLVDSLSRPIPWWLSYSHGLGTLRFIASNLGDEAFSSWVDRNRLWARLIAPYLDRGLTEVVEEKQIGESSFLGYSDLVGQLRATLDVFPAVRVVSFGQVAAMLVGVLLLIGPFDYLVSVKWLKRPELSWYIAGSLLLAITIGLTWMLAAIRPIEVHLNSAQVVDVDAAQGAVQGRLWSHVFSGSARELDIEVQSQNSQAAIRVDWQGLPGRGLGGLLSQLSTDRGMPTYEISGQPSGMTRMLGVGIPAAGTKCLVGHWTEAIELTATSELQQIQGVDQLEGRLANPLPYDLLDPVLFYHNWYYGLNSRIAAGQSVTISFDTIPKDISRRLNGRRTVDGNETTTKWDPADRGSIDRLLELMMFYKSASGQTYTSLTHRYQPQVDQSNLLQLDRAILLGRLERPWSKVVVTNRNQAEREDVLEVQQDLDRVWCRIAIPVQQRTSALRN